MFPHETVPDGHVTAPHHYYIGIFACVLILAVVWDNYRRREPVAVASVLVMGLFSFRYVWPFYPVAGALGALVGPLVAVLIVTLGWGRIPIETAWSHYALRYRLLVVLMLAIALDDALEHAFALQTPLDWLWKVAIKPALPST